MWLHASAMRFEKNSNSSSPRMISIELPASRTSFFTAAPERRWK